MPLGALFAKKYYQYFSNSLKTSGVIFFSSRMFDEFDIVSGEVNFSHEFDKQEDWILQRNAPHGGTLVRMVLHNHTARTTKKYSGCA